MTISCIDVPSLERTQNLSIVRQTSGKIAKFLWKITLSTITAEAVWKKWGTKLTDKLAKSTVHDQIGNQKVRKLKISPTVELTNLGEPLFVPFYFSYYTANIQSHFTTNRSIRLFLA